MKFQQKIKKKITLREFVIDNFKRAFKLPDTVAIDKIKAEYRSGILTFKLPKVKEALPQPKKLIAIKYLKNYKKRLLRKPLFIVP